MARTPLKRTTKVNAISAKRAAVADERRAFVQRVLGERTCEACMVLGQHGYATPHRRLHAADDVHELVRRSQGSPIVPSQGLRDEDVLAVCRWSHGWIGDHPTEAVRLGLARWGHRKNPPPGPG